MTIGRDIKTQAERSPTKKSVKKEGHSPVALRLARFGVPEHGRATTRLVVHTTPPGRNTEPETQPEAAAVKIYDPVQVITRV